MDESTRKLIEDHIQQNPVVLFMKGTRQMPQCGFSARVVQILDSFLPQYQTLDVLSDQNLRNGIKEYSSWPTIPQLYVRGEFIGGCDIVTELFESGELADKLGAKLEPTDPPKVTVSARARQALQGALASPEEVVRLEVSPSFEHALSIGNAGRADLTVELDGIKLVVDRLSADRANGVSIDYVETPQGPAFKIDNPNEPAKVKPISPAELKQRLDVEPALVVVDVRTPGEIEIAKLNGARPLDENTISELQAMDRSTEIVFYCHHGMRSQQAAQRFLAEGFKSVYNLTGGIDAWAAEVDPTMNRY